MVRQFKKEEDEPTTSGFLSHMVLRFFKILFEAAQLQRLMYQFLSEITLKIH